MWYIKTFDELTTKEFFDIIYERIRVFVVEQKSAFQDVDKIDLEALHLYKKSEGEIQAYMRIYEKEDGHISFGRVLVPKIFRGEGFGKELLEYALKYIEEKYPDQHVTIEAESYLENFYSSYGFKAYGEKYFDVDIEHQPMRLERK